MLPLCDEHEPLFNLCVNLLLYYNVLAELHCDLFSRNASASEFYAFVVVEEVNMLCPTRFVVDPTEDIKEGGLAAEVSCSQTRL